jgi:hypothetical protein
MNQAIATPLTAIALAALPPLGADLDAGKFAGITTKPDGTHCAIVLLPTKGEDLSWSAALNWAKEQGGELPSRPVASLLFANVKPELEAGWHWTSEEDEDNASYAWGCNFGDGVASNHKSYEGSAVAVRMIPLTA